MQFLIIDVKAISQLNFEVLSFFLELIGCLLNKPESFKRF